jgi:hypothetical protein
MKMVEVGKITLKEAAYNTIKSRRKEVSMESSQYNRVLFGLQKPPSSICISWEENESTKFKPGD